MQLPSPLLALLPLALACAWDAPLDPDYAGGLNVIEGTITVDSATSGPVLVLLYDAADPPPPEGTGRPINFTTVTEHAFDGATGLRSADYAFTNVPDGDWLVVAVQDTDGDFNPLFTPTAGATCGDVGGAHIDSLTSGEPAVVSTQGGVVASGVGVIVASVVPFERPAFVFVNNAVSQDGSDPLFTVSSTGVSSVTGVTDEPYTLTGPFDGTDTCDTAFWVFIPDDDGDGTPNAHPNASFAAAGLPEIWPRFYLQYLGDGAVTLAEDEVYASEVVINPTEILTSLALGEISTNTLIPSTELSLYYPGAAQHTVGGETSLVVGAEVPTGSWALTAVSLTGQTWTLPNALASLPSGDEASFVPATQSAALLIE